MTFDATPPRAPIGALGISALATAGVIVAVSVPAAAAAIAIDVTTANGDVTIS